MSRPQRPPRIGALDAANLPAMTSELDGTTTLDELARYGVAHGFGQIWIHRSALADLGLPPTLPSTAPADLAREGCPHPFTAPVRFRFHPPGLSYWIRCRDGEGGRVDVGIPAYDPASPFNACADARELRTAAALFASHLGIPYASSPGSTGAALLRAVHSGPGARRLAPAGEPPEPALRPATERDFSWWRPPDLDERAATLLHAFDVNGNYLAACSSIELGVGGWEELGDGRSLAVDPRTPGYWLCRLLPPGDLRLPDPLDPAARGGSRERWLTTPTAELAVELGRVQRVTRAVIWPERSRVLAPWYERIRDARTSLAAAAVAVDEHGRRRADDDTRPALVALRAVKETANLTIGQLAAHFRGVGDELHRPDWRHAVVARARANLFRHLARGAARTGRFPVAVDHDTAWYAGNVDDGPVPVDSGLGRFKYVGSVPMAAALDGPWDARSGLLSHLRGLLGAEP